MLRGSYPSGHKLVRGPLQSSLPLVSKLNDQRPDMARDGLNVVEWFLTAAALLFLSAVVCGLF
jgi:hypothetical protein